MSVDREILVRLTGLDYAPFSLLAQKLDAVQRALFNVGTALQGGGRRGKWKSEVLRACELHLVATRAGSLEIVGAVPPADVLPELAFDLGARSLDTFDCTVQAICDKDTQTLTELYPDFMLRSRVLKSVTPLLPEEGAEYDVDVAVRGGQLRRCTPKLRHFVARATAGNVEEEEAEGAIRTVTGKLFRIEVETGSRQLGIYHGARKIKCYFPPSYEEVVRGLVPGSLVEVEGHVSLSDNGEIAQFEEVLDARPIQLVPLHWKRVVYGNREFKLRKTITIDTDFQNGFWIHEHDPLRIYAWGRTRAESLDAFRQDFACLWDEIGLEADECLTEDAIELKHIIRSLVDEEADLA